MDQISSSDSGTLTNEQRTILLVGRSGNGKSSIGNSILGERLFPTGTQEYSLEPVIREKDDLKVIVCPFIGETGDDISYKLEDIQEATRKMLQNLVRTGSSGIDAIVFVLKYGVRFTKQEKDAVERVKEIFGDNVFSDFCIIAFSYGDLFSLDNSSRETEFDDWCLQQSGYIKALLIECDYRCVLFNNRKKVQRQITNLWECVETNNFKNKKTSVQSCVGEAGKETTTENQKENENEEFVQESSGKNNIDSLNKEVVEEEKTMNEIEKSYYFITKKDILEEHSQETETVNVSDTNECPDIKKEKAGEDFVDVTRQENTEIGDSVLYLKQNTGDENTMLLNEKEIKNKDIKDPECEYKQKRKISRKYTISDFDNLKRVLQKENNKMNDSPKNKCSLLSCFP